jgi:ribosome modulation factor
MRIDINEQAWNRGFWDGDSGKPSLACPYGLESDERLSWASGYIEGKAFRNGYIATPPGSRVPLRKSALAAELCAVPLCSTAPSSAAQDPRQRGVKIARRSGVNFGSRLTQLGAKFEGAPARPIGEALPSRRPTFAPSLMATNF